MNPEIQIPELKRLQALYHYQILDTPPEGGFDDIVNLVAQVCDTPIAMIAFIDEQRQWPKSCLGLPLVETDRSIVLLQSNDSWQMAVDGAGCPTGPTLCPKSFGC